MTDSGKPELKALARSYQIRREEADWSTTLLQPRDVEPVLLERIDRAVRVYMEQFGRWPVVVTIKRDGAILAV